MKIGSLKSRLNLECGFNVFVITNKFLFKKNRLKIEQASLNQFILKTPAHNSCLIHSLMIKTFRSEFFYQNTKVYVVRICSS